MFCILAQLENIPDEKRLKIKKQLWKSFINMMKKNIEFF
jgi:hypothetical protein